MAIKSLYNSQEATVRTEYGNTEWFNIEQVVRQGCILSPYAFNAYSEAIIKNADLDVGVNIVGSKNKLTYADDTTLTTSEENLQTIILSVKEHNENAGLYLNTQKKKKIFLCLLLNYKISD
ncbi:hypothetical protein BsWGS_17352 [Bradybaena similaris]